MNIKTGLFTISQKFWHTFMIIPKLQLGCQSVSKLWCRVLVTFCDKAVVRVLVTICVKAVVQDISHILCQSCGEGISHILCQSCGAGY